MKFLFSVLALSLNGLAFSQTIEVKENEGKFSTGPHNALVTTVYGNSAGDVMKAWKKTLKQYKSESIKASKNELVADNVLVKEWGTGLVDFYTVLEENKKEKTVRMSVAANLGDAYLASSLDKSKYYDLEKILKEFAVETTKKPIDKELEMHNKQFVKVQKKQISFEREKRDLEEEIENYKGKISKAEVELIPKESEIAKKKEEVAAQKRVIDASSGAVSEQVSSSRKIYDKLVKQQESLEKDLKNLRADIEDYTAKVRKKEKKVMKNKENQSELLELSNQTKDKISRAKERLSAVN